jgi:hypothetical protein
MGKSYGLRRIQDFRRQAPSNAECIRDPWPHAGRLQQLTFADRNVLHVSYDRTDLRALSKFLAQLHIEAKSAVLIAISGNRPPW